MIVYGYAAHDCQIKSNLYKQSGNTDTEFDTTEPKEDVVIEMSGKNDFKGTRELIELMEAESKIIINWSYNVKILKRSCEKYNLNKDLVKVLHRRYVHPLGQL
jgi:hypothetical protein